MHIRLAEMYDIESIKKLLIKFASEYSETIPYGQATEEYQDLFIQNIIEKHICFVAELDTEIIGVIGGLVAPHIYNPTISTVSELFWYVDEAHRKTSAGARLLSEFKSHASKIANVIYMVLLDTSPINHRSLIRRGFKPKETHFILEV